MGSAAADALSWWVPPQTDGRALYKMLLQLFDFAALRWLLSLQCVPLIHMRYVPTRVCTHFAICWNYELRLDLSVNLLPKYFTLWIYSTGFSWPRNECVQVACLNGRTTINLIIHNFCISDDFVSRNSKNSRIYHWNAMLRMQEIYIGRFKIYEDRR